MSYCRTRHCLRHPALQQQREFNGEDVTNGLHEDLENELIHY